MRKLLTAVLTLGLLAVPLRAAEAAPGRLVFADEFNGTAIDRTKWTIHSNAEADQCLGNKGNQQLEWHTWDALSVRDGKLTMTARKNNPAPGYEWSGALITTGQACGHEPPQSFAVQPGDYRRQLQVRVTDGPHHRLAHDRPAPGPRRNRLVPRRPRDLPPGPVLRHRRRADPGPVRVRQDPPDRHHRVDADRPRPRLPPITS